MHVGKRGREAEKGKDFAKTHKLYFIASHRIISIKLFRLHGEHNIVLNIYRRKYNKNMNL
jgi:hypothetical protein